MGGSWGRGDSIFRVTNCWGRAIAGCAGSATSILYFWTPPDSGRTGSSLHPSNPPSVRTAFPLLPSPAAKQYFHSHKVQYCDSVWQIKCIEDQKFLILIDLWFSSKPFRYSGIGICNLTLPSLKAWGFLIHRLTFKHRVLAAVLKPFNRTIVQIDESNSQ